MKLTRFGLTAAFAFLFAAFAFLFAAATFPADAASNSRILHRGTDVSTGVHSVSYVDSAGHLQKTTEAELDAAGVDIWNLAEVAEHLSLRTYAADNNGGGFFVGPDGIAGTPDDHRETERSSW